MTNWQYTDAGNQVVFRTRSDGTQESCLVTAIADWIAEGNSPEPYVEPPPSIPTSLTMKQARRALHQAGYLEQVEAGVQGMDKPSQIDWEFASTVERGDPLVLTLAAALGLTAVDLDSLFILGASL
jgi:hypothetical protein